METDRNSAVGCIILAAGQGTRMKSYQTKIRIPFFGKPLVEHIIDHLIQSGISYPVLVVSPGDYSELSSLYHQKAILTIQKEPLGTGDAVKAGLGVLPESSEYCLIVCGDTPLLSPSTLLHFISSCIKAQAAAGVITAEIDHPRQYGRIIRDSQGEFQQIIEYKDATEQQRNIQEVNSGVYLFKTDLLEEAISTLSTDNAAKEYYFTDTLSGLHQKGYRIFTHKMYSEEDMMGINTKMDYAKALQIANQRHLEELMIEHGVFILDPASTYIESSVTIGKDSVIKPFTYLEGNITIGEKCQIGPFVCMRGTEPILIDNEAMVGPFSSLRGGTNLERDVHIGTFVELKKTKVGPNSKAMHLSYLGDAEIGSRVNIGAGTITCNYDGLHKYITRIEDDVFIGSDTIIVAPLTIHQKSYVAAGSTLTEDVPAFALALGRARQLNKLDWSKNKSPLREKDDSKK